MTVCYPRVSWTLSPLLSLIAGICDMGTHFGANVHNSVSCLTRRYSSVLCGCFARRMQGWSAYHLQECCCVILWRTIGVLWISRFAIWSDSQCAICNLFQSRGKESVATSKQFMFKCERLWRACKHSIIMFFAEWWRVLLWLHHSAYHSHHSCKSRGVVGKLRYHATLRSGCIKAIYIQFEGLWIRASEHSEKSWQKYIVKLLVNCVIMLLSRVVA